MPQRFETAPVEMPGKVRSEGVLCTDAEAGRARTWGRVLLSGTKGHILLAEGRRKPWKSLEQGSGVVCVLEASLSLAWGTWIGCVGRRISCHP